MTTSTEVKIHPVSWDTELGAWDSNAGNPRPAILYLDARNGELWAGTGWPGTAPHVRTWPIPAFTADAANTLLKLIEPLAARLLAGDVDAAGEIDTLTREFIGDQVVVVDAAVTADAADAADAALWLAAQIREVYAWSGTYRVIVSGEAIAAYRDQLREAS